MTIQDIQEIKSIFSMEFHLIERRIIALESKCVKLQEHDANRELDLFSLKEKCTRLEEELYRKPQIYGGFKPESNKSPGRDELPEKQETKECEVYIKSIKCTNCGQEIEVNKSHVCKSSPASKKTLAEKFGSNTRRTEYIEDCMELSKIAEQHYLDRFNSAIKIYYKPLVVEALRREIFGEKELS